jgi:hypothetical protein
VQRTRIRVHDWVLLILGIIPDDWDALPPTQDGFPFQPTNEEEGAMTSLQSVGGVASPVPTRGQTVGESGEANHKPLHPSTL